MDEMQDPTPFEIPHGRLMTLKEAAAKTGRNLKVLQRWHAQGLLPSRFEQAKGHHAILVTLSDLDKVATMRKRGTRRPRQPRRFTTENGIVVRIRARPVKKEG